MMMRNHLHCFRSRCRLPVRLIEAYINQGIVYCSKNCCEKHQEEIQLMEKGLMTLPFKGSVAILREHSHQGEPVVKNGLVSQTFKFLAQWHSHPSA
jgi:hypothetical protein